MLSSCGVLLEKLYWSQGVYHCGYHSEASYGATSYFITHPDGNILVDRDDVADHKKWSNRLGCHRVLHSQDKARVFVYGCVSLFYKPLKVIFTGDHFGKEQSELSIWVQYNHYSAPGPCGIIPTNKQYYLSGNGDIYWSLLLY
ncbi:hypothetical protein MKW98_031196 [Papaver atlanticum]|uniref:Uncharacterized protein n=1 Tax=Papaver atlanticum TaxID=357466 RepID=A0AAD4T5C6_9MAGN|nr:hypothetical protein MKW98_031196 [Papaver atlanticum]